MDDLIIYGAGAVAGFVVLNPDLFDRRWRVVAMVDDDPAKVGTSVWGVEVWSRQRLDSMSLRGVAMLVAIASPGVRERMVGELEARGARFPDFVARGSWISAGVTIGRGVVIYPGCAVEHETRVDNFAIINAGCTIGHNARVGEYATISPGVHLAGHTQVGRGAFLGIGCCTRQGVEIGPGAVVGGQAMVLNNVEGNTTVVGLPATAIKN
jgi:acetyltransferase EpsM